MPTDPPLQLCKDCEHCSVHVEHSLHEYPYRNYASATCMKTGRFSYVTGKIVNADLCESRRSRLNTPNCPDYEPLLPRSPSNPFAAAEDLSERN